MKPLANSKFLQYSLGEKKIAFAVFGILWVYLFIRAIYVPVLHDEIATFFYYIQSDNYLPPAAHWDANNHLLNSMFANSSYHLFGSSPLSLRLPNVLSYGMLLYAAFQISGRLNKKIIRWGLLLALICSHYMFEYFGECRGYGMSMAFFLMALYYFFRLKETVKWKYILFISFFLFLGTAANLTLILPSLLVFGFVLMWFIQTFFKTNKQAWIIHSFIVFCSALPFLFLVKFSFELKGRNAFYYGGDTGFYDITVSSLSSVFTDFYNLPIAIAITAIFICFILFLVFLYIKGKTVFFILSNKAFFPALLVGSILAILFVSYRLKVNFPEDRAAMHLYILFIASFAYVLNDLAEKYKPMIYASALLFYFPLLFAFHASPTASVFSTQERTSDRIFNYIKKSPRNFKFPNLVGGYKTQEFCWYYLNNRSGGKEGKIHTNYHIAYDEDFQIIRDGKIKDSTLFEYYTPVLSDPTTELTLFERKNKLNKKLIFTSTIKPTSGEITNEFYNILEMDISLLRNNLLYIGTEMTLITKTKPFIGQIAVTINDVSGASLYLDYIPLDWIQKDWGTKKNNVLQGILLHNIPAQAEVLKFYIWNIDNTTYSIPDGKCYLYHIDRDFPS